MSNLTHLDAQGRARMVDVSGKPSTAREAIAEGRVTLSREALARAIAGDGKKGDVRAAAEIRRTPSIAMVRSIAFSMS